MAKGSGNTRTGSANNPTGVGGSNSTVSQHDFARSLASSLGATDKVVEHETHVMGEKMQNNLIFISARTVTRYLQVKVLMEVK